MFRQMVLPSFMTFMRYYLLRKKSPQAYLSINCNKNKGVSGKIKQINYRLPMSNYTGQMRRPMR